MVIPNFWQFYYGLSWWQNRHINHLQTNAMFDHCFRIKTKDIAIFHISHDGSLPWDDRKIILWLPGLMALGTAGVSLILFYLYVCNLWRVPSARKHLTADGNVARVSSTITETVMSVFKLVYWTISIGKKGKLQWFVIFCIQKQLGWMVML